MSSPRQIPLDLGFRPALGREDFFVAPGNTDAVTWIDRWPDWPRPVLALFGPAGCGKSHLAQVFAARSGARVIAAHDVRTEDVGDLVRAVKSVVVEDGDRGVNETALFHLYNALTEAGGWLLLTGRDAPARWNVALPDLRSRLAAVHAARIEAPDDGMIQAVLVKLFADRQITVGPEVIAYLLRNMDRTFAAARAIVDMADRESLAGQRSVTVPLVKDLLARQGPAL
ncbi:MAG: DNA replication protein [Rhodospirillaceae bacterium]|nr:DNA replication protein [Rhodospirillaceae bacterium]